MARGDAAVINVAKSQIHLQRGGSGAFQANITALSSLTVDLSLTLPEGGGRGSTLSQRFDTAVATNRRHGCPLLSLVKL